MKLQIMSNAHMQVDCGFGREYGKFDFPAVAPNLVLLGSMGRICDVELQDFIILQLTRFERVFYVMGMDEFYQSSVETGRQQMQAFAENLIKNPPKKLPNGEMVNKLGVFHYLHRTRIDVEDVTILGCTLWRGWKENSSQARRLGDAAYRPIKDFFAEEEIIERNLDIAWLQLQLEVCANGEVTVPMPGVRADEGMVAPPEQPVVDLVTAPMDVDNDGIYNDVEMPSSIKPTNLPGDQQPEGVPPVNQPPPEPSESIAAPSSVERQGPPRRVIILTAHPPTFKGTTVPYRGPARGEQTKEAVFVLQGRQCWVMDNTYGSGVVVHSIHKSDISRPQKGDSLWAETEQLMDIKMAETPSCGHDSGLTGDPYRPPGVALWAFGYTEWSCDTDYEAPVTIPTASDPKGKKPEATEQSTDDSNRCPQCNRVPAPIRLVSNQRGQQWDRNLEPYVDVPPTWRAFDGSFVVDV
ncbi:hypothetical protein OPQ81_006408 [Rhizoctonia solani]|nr:hypothetical protein OPQ81_006408 [Rhizoctonia solani]